MSMPKKETQEKIHELIDYVVNRLSDDEIDDFYDFCQMYSLKEAAYEWSNEEDIPFQECLQELELEASLPIGTTEQRLQRTTQELVTGYR